MKFFITILLIISWIIYQTINWPAENYVELDAKIKLGQTLTIILTLSWAYIMMEIRKLYRYKVDMGLYKRIALEVPESYSPNLLHVLRNKGELSTEDLLSSLLYLCRKGYCRLELLQNNRMEYAITKNQIEQKDWMSPSDNYLVSWLFYDYGDGSTIILGDMVNRITDLKSALNFKKKFSEWRIQARKDDVDRAFYITNNKLGCLFPIAIGLVYFIFGMTIGKLTGFFYAAILPVLGIILFFYMFGKRRRTRYGEEQLKKWDDWAYSMKKDFVSKTWQLTEIGELEDAFIYALSYNIADKIIPGFEARFKEGNIRIQISEEDIIEKTSFLKQIHRFGTVSGSELPFLFGYKALRKQFEDLYPHAYKWIGPYEKEFRKRHMNN